MIRALNSTFPDACERPLSCSKKTPGDRCSWLTMTRSVPLMMNVARSDMRGISPKKTSCSLTSRMVRAPVFSSTSKMTSWTVTLMGAAYVTPRSRHSSSDHFSSPIA